MISNLILIVTILINFYQILLIIAKIIVILIKIQMIVLILVIMQIIPQNLQMFYQIYFKTIITNNKHLQLLIFYHN